MFGLTLEKEHSVCMHANGLWSDAHTSMEIVHGDTVTPREIVRSVLLQ